MECRTMAGGCSAGWQEPVLVAFSLANMLRHACIPRTPSGPSISLGLHEHQHVGLVRRISHPLVPVVRSSPPSSFVPHPLSTLPGCPFRNAPLFDTPTLDTSFATQHCPSSPL